MASTVGIMALLSSLLNTDKWIPNTMPSLASIFNVRNAQEEKPILVGISSQNLTTITVVTVVCILSILRVQIVKFFPVMHAYILKKAKVCCLCCSALATSFVFSLLAKHHLSFDASGRRKLRNKNRKKKKINAKAAFYPTILLFDYDS